MGWWLVALGVDGSTETGTEQVCTGQGDDSRRVRESEWSLSPEPSEKTPPIRIKQVSCKELNMC